MKILAIANISNLDDLVCDSGIIFQRILAKEFYEQQIEYHILGPNHPQFLSYVFPYAQKHAGPIGTTRFSSRFHFDWYFFEQLIGDLDPDIIFNNQVELASSIKSVLVSLGKSHIKLITYCHYPAIWGVSEDGVPIIDESLNYGNLCTPIIFDILSALTVSDKFIIQSNFAKNLIETAARYHRISNFALIAVIPPPADNSIQKGLKQSNKTRRVLYNHRLYQTYGTGNFLDFIESCQDLNFELAVSDPMPNRSSVRSGLNSTPNSFRMRVANIKNAVLYNGNVSREEYAKLILSSRVAFGALRKACVWSMACIDCMRLGVPVIAPSYGAYPEFIPQELIFNDIPTARILMQNLLNDDEFWSYSSKISQMKAAVFEPSIIALQFLDIFNKVY